MHPNLPWENITFMFLQLNTLCIIQPLDQGIIIIVIKAFNAYCRSDL